MHELRAIDKIVLELHLTFLYVHGSIEREEEHCVTKLVIKNMINGTNLIWIVNEQEFIYV